MGCLPTKVHRQWRLLVQTLSSIILKKWGKRAIRALRCCWSWADYDLATWAGKWSWGTQCGRQERENQQREVQNLHFWQSPSLVATSNGRCTDTWCCWEEELHPHLSEFPLSWTRSWWKSIFTLLLLQAWKKGNGDNTCERAPKEETSRAAPVKGRGRKSSPCPDQSRLLLQTMVVQKPCYYRIPGIGGRALRYFFSFINPWW